MNNQYLIIEFICSYILTAGVSYYLYVPKNSISKVGFIGAGSWCIYKILTGLNINSIISTFLATCFISIMSEILARKFKKASTVYLLPSILPLVPGVGLYNTMMFFVQKDIEQGLQLGINTFMLAIAMASGILVSSSFVKMTKRIKDKVKSTY